jgi:hypothetical protein
VELLPAAPWRAAVIEGLQRSLAQRLPASALRLGELRPVGRERLLDEARRWVADLGAGAASPWCEADRMACESNALSAGRALVEADPRRCDSHLVVGEVTRLGGGVAAEVRYLWDNAVDVDDRGTCLRAIAEASRRAKDGRSLARAIDALATLPCVEPLVCAKNLEWLASLEADRGNGAAAVALLRKATRLVPDRIDLRERLAQRASRLGLHAEALLTLRPQEERYRRAKAAEEEALRRALFDDRR